MSAKQQAHNSKVNPDGKANDFSIANNPYNAIKRTIAVLSGKGSVPELVILDKLADMASFSGKPVSFQCDQLFHRVKVLPLRPHLTGGDPVPEEAGEYLYKTVRGV